MIKDPDLIARGMMWEQTEALMREACAQAGVQWTENDKPQDIAVNVMQRLANNAHKEGFKLALKRISDHCGDDSLIESQIDGLFEGEGASEDHESVLAFFKAIGFTDKMAARIHQAIVNSEKLGRFIHYPEHWDTAAYPTVQMAVYEIVSNEGCSQCKPKPVRGRAQMAAAMEKKS